MAKISPSQTSVNKFVVSGSQSEHGYEIGVLGCNNGGAVEWPMALKSGVASDVRLLSGRYVSTSVHEEIAAKDRMEGGACLDHWFQHWHWTGTGRGVGRMWSPHGDDQSAS